MNTHFLKIDQKLLLLLLLAAPLRGQMARDCPQECSVCVPKVVICESGGLLHWPLRFPVDTLNVTLVGHHFLSTFLGPANLSGLAATPFRLERLALRASSIQVIYSRTFSSLKSLISLDLSENQVLRLDPDAFADLNLISLRLCDIGRLRLRPEAFRYLHVRQLLIDNSHLGSLDYDVFDSLISSGLKHLSLSNNNFRTIDPKFEALFRSVTVIKLNLTGNPIVCNCSLLWLKSLVRTSMQNLTLPRCVSPSNMRDRGLADVDESEFRCFPPRITSVHLNVRGGGSQVRLLCQAESSSDPDTDRPVGGANDLEISWYREEDKSALQHSDPGSSELELLLTRPVSGQSTRLRCAARNRIGVTQLHILLAWPPLLQVFNTSLQLTPGQPRNGDRGPDNRVLDEITLSSSFYFMKRYTLVELIVAVISTFICTVLLFFLVYKFCLFSACCEQHKYPQKSSAHPINSAATAALFSAPSYDKMAPPPPQSHYLLASSGGGASSATTAPLHYPPYHLFSGTTSEQHLSGLSLPGESNSQTYDCISVNNALFPSNSSSNNNTTASNPGYNVTLKKSLMNNSSHNPNTISSSNKHNHIHLSSASIPTATTAMTGAQPPPPPPPQFIDYKTHETLYAPQHSLLDN